MSYKSVYDIRIGDIVYFIHKVDEIYYYNAKTVSRIDITGTCLSNTVAEVYLKGKAGAIGVTIAEGEAGKFMTEKSSAQKWCNYMNQKSKEKNNAE